MISTKCPVCKTIPPDDLRDEPGLILCHGCGVTWTAYTKPIETSVLYADEVYKVIDARKSIFEKIIRQEAINVLKSAERLIGKSAPRKILDFGCGKGIFLYMAKKRGWEVLGMETAASRAAFARDIYGIEVITEEYTGGKTGNSEYSAISLLHVLEHLPNPMELLSELTENNLAENGVLIVEVPNYHSFQSFLAGSRWLHLDIPRHFTHWHLKNLESEFKKLGFTPVKKAYFSVHMGLLGMLTTLLQHTGYRGSIIADLKQKLSLYLVLRIFLLLPVALILESLSCLLKRSGIIRIYFRKI